MSAPYDPYSDASGSDSDDAPEEVTVSSAKKGLQQEKKKALEEQRRYVLTAPYTVIDYSQANLMHSLGPLQASARKERKG
jgi:hypothetical protein